MTKTSRLLPLILALTGGLHAAVNVSIPNTSVARGATVEIPVQTSGYTITTGDSLVAYQMAIVFDPLAVQAVGTSPAGTMTANWGDPMVNVKVDVSANAVKRDTFFVVGITTNQPGKKTAPDAGILVKLRLLITGAAGNTTTLVLHDIRMFNLQGAMSIGTKTNGVLTVTDNPSSTISLQLYPGINFISFPITPNPNTVPAVLGSVPVTFIWGYMSGLPKSWAYLRPVNDLKYLDGLHGYWMKLNDTVSRTLNLSGQPVDVTTPIQLIKGLNLIGYLPSVSDSLTHSLASLDTQYYYLWSFEAATQTPRSWRRGRISDLKVMKPFLAYWIRMYKTSTLVYPSSGYRSAKRIQEPVNIIQAVAGRPAATEICDFWGMQPDLLAEGDSILAFDSSGAPCGSTDVLADGLFLIHVSGDDPETQDVDEGATTGEEIRFQLGSRQLQVAGVSTSNDTSVIPGVPAVWQSMGNYRIEFRLVPEGIGERGPIPDDIRLMPNHPNPFNHGTCIRYRLGGTTRVRLDIFQTNGEWVTTLADGSQSAGEHSVVWDGTDHDGMEVTSGLYVYCLRTGSRFLSRKCLLVK